MGESGLKSFKLTDERLAAFSSWWALPSKLRTDGLPRNEVELAKQFGVTSKFLQEVKRRPEMVAAVREKLHACAVYSMPDVLWKQIEVAETGDTKAARFVAEISQTIKQAGGVQVMNNVITPTVRDEVSDEALIRQVVAIRDRLVKPSQDDVGEADHG